MGCHFLLQGIFLTRDQTLSLASPTLAGGFFTMSAIWDTPKSYDEYKLERVNTKIIHKWGKGGGSLFYLTLFTHTHTHTHTYTPKS